MQNITKILFGLSLQVFALFCLIFAYAERKMDVVAFPAFIIAFVAMIAGLIHAWSAYRKGCCETDAGAPEKKKGPNYVYKNGKVVKPEEDTL